MIDSLPDERPSVSVLTGFLGSGKTTLLNRLLQHPQMGETAVIVNEFGEIGIDHALVQSSSDNLVLLSSGCVCCTVRGDLLHTLSELMAKRAQGSVPAFGRVVIETTGLADPAPILQALISDLGAVAACRLGLVATVVDALHGARALDEHSEAVKQIALADRLVLSKSDLASPLQTQQLLARVREINPLAEIVVAVLGDAEPTRLFGSAALTPAEKSEELRRWLGSDAPAGHDHADDAARQPIDHNRHDGHIRAHCLRFDAPLDWAWIANGLDALVLQYGEQLLRLKGLVNVVGQDQPVLIQGVHHMLYPPVALPAWPDADRRTRLVFIARDLDRPVIEAGIAAGAAEGVSTADL